MPAGGLVPHLLVLARPALAPGAIGFANDLMDRLPRVSSPLGLYAEEFEVSSGHHLSQLRRRSRTSR
jgi:hypothetical protein